MSGEDHEAVFAALLAILKKYERRTVVQTDQPGNYCLITKQLDAKKRPVYFAAAQQRKKYVSFHLMPVYCFPDLLDDLSPELKKRMQGKSCFNFNSVDRALFKELAALIKRSFERYKSEGLV